MAIDACTVVAVFSATCVDAADVADNSGSGSSHFPRPVLQHRVRARPGRLPPRLLRGVRARRFCPFSERVCKSAFLFLRGGERERYMDAGGQKASGSLARTVKWSVK